MTNNVFMEEFVFIWKIENLRYCVLPKGKFLQSPSFNLVSFFGTSWHLKFYPNGCKNSTEGYVSCYLHREYGSDCEGVEVNFELSMGKVSYVLNHTFPANGQSWGHRHFQLLPLNCESEVVKCYMQMCPSMKMCNTFFTSFLDQEFENVEDPDLRKMITETIGCLNKVVWKGRKKVFADPSKCFAVSQCLVEKRIYVWPIDASIFNETQSKQFIPFYSVRKNLEVFKVFIELHHRTDNGKEYLSINLNFLNIGLLERPLIICKVCLLDSGVEITNKIEEKRLFTEIKLKHLWPLDCSFEIEYLKQKIKSSFSNKLKLCFEFEFAFGDVHSKIEWELNQDCPDKDCQADGISHQISKLYEENKFCDVVIQTKNRIYNVHKTVICAMSPVFSAMFSSGMIENDTNTISINDVDEDTLGEMISFMYTGKLKKLEFNMARNLFAAADKYEILSLKNLCRDFIINNLSVENVCEVMILSTNHTDSKLKWSALKFISVHKSTVLVSSEWKFFEKNNINLAVDFLRQICLNLPSDIDDPVCHINSR